MNIISKKVKIRQAKIEDIPKILYVEKETWGEKNSDIIKAEGEFPERLTN